MDSRLFLYKRIQLSPNKALAIASALSVLRSACFFSESEFSFFSTKTYFCVPSGYIQNHLFIFKHHFDPH